jgi:ATPase subunit of ABC transporter with duplicated ATPase domains
VHAEEIHDDVHDRFNELGGYRLEAKAKQILAGLSFREKDADRPAREMSGGWVMRAHLARLLTQEPDLLLLDEPTNHLDLEALLWFQEYLKGYPGAILVISHDREFLNQLVGSIVEIRQSKLIRYRGGYDEYLLQREAYEQQQLAAYKNQEREIGRLMEFVNRFRAKNTKAAQAQSKLKQIERMDKVEAPEGDDRKLDFRFPQPQRSGLRVDQAGEHPPRLRREGGLSRHEFSGRARPAHRAGRAERGGQIHVAEDSRRRAHAAGGRRARSATTPRPATTRSIAWTCCTRTAPCSRRRSIPRSA